MHACMHACQVKRVYWIVQQITGDCDTTGWPDNDCAGAIAGLWPLAEGTFVMQLLSGLPANQLPLLAHLYHLLLSSLPILAPATGCQADKEEPRFVNALVRTPFIHLHRQHMRVKDSWMVLHI